MDKKIDLSATAAASPEQSVREEREAVGEHPDTGPLVSEDHSQRAPDDESPDPRSGLTLPVTGPPD